MYLFHHRAVINEWRFSASKKRETYAKMALDNVMDVRGAVLVELEMVSRAFLWAIKIEQGSAGKRVVNEMKIPKIMTATSTEQRTPSSYAFLKRPFLRWRSGGPRINMVVAKIAK